VVGNPDEIDAWKKAVFEEVGASAFVERAVFKPTEAASVVSAGGAVYFRIPAMVPHRDQPIVYVNGLVLDKLLVTWRTEKIDSITDLIEELTSPTVLPWVTTTSDLVAALCVNFSTDSFEASQDLRHKIDKISDDATSGRQIDGSALDAASAGLEELDEVSGDYTQVFVMLRDSNSTALDLEGKHSRIKIAIASSHAVTRRVKLYYERIAQLRRQQATEVSAKTSRRLGMLSVISAIFLPLTLLTGIFGMNFQHMPGLSWSWTYPTLILLMAATVGGLLWYFRKTGWI
jgi:magnesium transporter